MTYYYIPQRVSNAVMIYLNPRESQPEPLPLELQDLVSVDQWMSRVADVKLMSSRYSKPMLERLWTLIGFLIIVIAPTIIYEFLSRAFVHPSQNSIEHDFGSESYTNFDGFFTARAIAFGIFVGLAIMVYVPIGIWKSRGRRQSRYLAGRWETEDRSLLGGRLAPQYTIKLPGVFSNTIVVSAVLPANISSAFHPAVYLPIYINPSPNGEGQYSGITGVPGITQSSLGNVPLYTDEKIALEQESRV